MKHNKKKKFNRHSVKFKLFTSLILLMILPLCILGGLSYKKSFNMLKVQSDHNVNQLNVQINDTISEFFSSIERDISMVSTLQGFKNLAEDESLSKGKHIDESDPAIVNARSVLGTLVSENENIKAAYIGTANKNMYSATVKRIYGVNSETDATKRPWYVMAKENPYDIIWTKPQIDINKANKEEIKVITAAKTLKVDGKITGVIAIDINLKNLIEKINSIKVGDSGYVVITDSEGNVLIHRDEAQIDEKLVFEDMIPLLKESTDAREVTLNGDKSYLQFVTNKNTDWKIISVFPYNDLHKQTNEILTFTLILIVIIFIFSIIAMDIVCRNIILKHIKSLKIGFSRVSSGDLTTRVDIKTKDEFNEIGENFNEMIQDLGDIINSAKETSLTLTDKAESLTAISTTTTKAANEIAVTIQDISKTSFDQAETTTREQDNMDEFSMVMDNISNSIMNIKNSFEDTKNLNLKGLQTLKQLTEKTQEASTAEANLKDIVFKVDSGSKEIGTIISTINDISKQTNLLALNASIESARAGTAGKGFAVVATEVRKLAEESSDAVQSIQSLVNHIQNNSQNAVSTIIGNESIITEQESVVYDTEAVFNNISAQIDKLSEDIQEIELLNFHMMDKKGQMVSSIDNIADLADKNSQSSEEASASTEETFANIEELDSHIGLLKALADNLDDVLKKFKI